MYITSDYKLAKDIPYLTLAGEIWSVFCEYFGEKKKKKKTNVLWRNMTEK